MWFLSPLKGLVSGVLLILIVKYAFDYFKFFEMDFSQFIFFVGRDIYDNIDYTGISKILTDYIFH